MGKAEELLKEKILSEYKSIREFTQKIEMPYSTLDTILKRGIRKASVDNIIRVCDVLDISTDALINGRIERKSSEPTTLAAHLDGNDFTDEQWERIQSFAKFIKQEDK